MIDYRIINFSHSLRDLETGQAAELDSHDSIINRYAQIVTKIGPSTGEFENGKKINVTYCALKNSNQIKVVKPGEIP